MTHLVICKDSPDYLYGMYESVTQMLEELIWVPLSKRRENACLILCLYEKSEHLTYFNSSFDRT